MNEKRLHRISCRALSLGANGSYFILRRHRYSCGSSHEDERFDILWGHPHGTTGGMLLEMAFIFIPEINPRSVGVLRGYFHMPAARSDRNGQSMAGVLVDEAPAV